MSFQVSGYCQTASGGDSLSRAGEILPDSVSVKAGSDSLFQRTVLTVGDVRTPVKMVVSVNPSKTMYRSLALPGWGQLENGRKKKALLFMTAEAICIGGYLYCSYELKNDKYSDLYREQIKTDRNSYILYWLLSKLFGMVDAYVDAQLKNYNVRDITPEELK